MPMSEVTIGAGAGAGNGALPPSRAACQARIAELQDEIAAIRAQIASADLDRQARRGRIDARWFHRAKTALRHRRRELAELTAHMASAAGPGRPEGSVQGLPDRGAARRLRG